MCLRLAGETGAVWLFVESAVRLCAASAGPYDGTKGKTLEEDTFTLHCILYIIRWRKMIIRIFGSHQIYNDFHFLVMSKYKVIIIFFPLYDFYLFNFFRHINVYRKCFKVNIVTILKSVVDLSK